MGLNPKPDLLHQKEVQAPSKWWPLPTHQTVHRSRFSFPKLATLKMLYCSNNSQPSSKTIWVQTLNIPLSERMTDRGEWDSIIQGL